MLISYVQLLLFIRLYYYNYHAVVYSFGRFVWYNYQICFFIFYVINNEPYLYLYNYITFLFFFLNIYYDLYIIN